jgi:hypothetical protein
MYVSGDLDASNNTLTGNVGHGIDFDNAVGLPAHLMVGNNIIAGNTLPDLSGAITYDLGHNLIGDPTDGSGYVASDLLNVNPLLAPLGDYGGPTQTFAPLPGSPAIDAGDNTNASATDQRGLARIVNGTIDIGAFESRGFTMTITGGDNQATVITSSFSAPLSVAVSSAFAEPFVGGAVTFVPPQTDSGTGVVFLTSNPATLDASGQASVSVAANGVVGSITVIAAARGASPVAFHLGNINSNIAPIITSLDGPTTGAPGQTLNYTGWFTDPDSMDTWTAIVNFGDGSGDQSVALNPDKTFAFDHYFRDNGIYPVTLSVADNHGGSDTRSFLVVINTVPVITQLNGPTTDRLRGQLLQFSGAFSDRDSGDIWIATVNFGDGSGEQALPLNQDKTFAFDHAYTDIGTFTVAVTLFDSRGGIATRSRSVSIVNKEPSVVIFGPTTGAAGQSLHYSGAFTDPDPDTWTGTVNFGDGTGDQPLTLNSVQSFAIDHEFATAGNYSLGVTVSDNHGGVGTRSLTVTITGNRPPVAQNDTATLTTATSAIIKVMANDSDPDHDALTVTSVTQPASGHGTVVINADGAVIYTQTVFINGTETFNYTISDGHGETVTATVTVTVNLPATAGVDMLQSQIGSSSLSSGQQSSLAAKLSAAQQNLARGNRQAAAKQLTAFANEVRAYKRAHILAAGVADLWLLEVDNLLAVIGPTGP